MSKASEDHYKRAMGLLAFIRETDEDGDPIVKDLEKAQVVILASIAESLAGLLRDRVFGYHS